MGAREYVTGTVLAWRKFQASNPVEATRIENLILGICGDMSAESVGRKQQIGAMKTSNEYTELRAFTRAHADDFGIRNDSDQEFALWIRTICFFKIQVSQRDNAA